MLFRKGSFSLSSSTGWIRLLYYRIFAIGLELDTVTAICKCSCKCKTKTVGQFIACNLQLINGEVKTSNWRVVINALKLTTRQCLENAKFWKLLFRCDARCKFTLNSLIKSCMCHIYIVYTSKTSPSLSLMTAQPIFLPFLLLCMKKSRRGTVILSLNFSLKNAEVSVWLLATCFSYSST